MKPASIIPPDPQKVARIIKAALEEDIGAGDITTKALVPAQAMAEFWFVPREPIILCGALVVAEVFRTLDNNVKVESAYKEGEYVRAGTKIISVAGSARVLLTGERTALNLLQRMCGVADYASQFVEAVKGTKAVILDTRKTMPGLRELDKYAVRAGGGQNHRMRLDAGILIKDNHIALCGGVAEAVRRMKAEGLALPIEVECDTLDQVAEALAAGADRLLLDNMTPEQVGQALEHVKGRVKLEASGGITLANVREYAETGVDYISIGALTRSAPNADIGMDWVK